MGIWIGIKRALNSTLGTTKFKPLDKILKDSMYLVASDTVLYNIGRANGLRGQEKTFFEKTINVNGTIRFVATDSSSLSSSYDYVRIYKNNTLVKTIPYTTSNGLPITDITVEKGSVLKLSLYTVDSGGFIGNVDICGFATLAPDDGIFL